MKKFSSFDDAFKWTKELLEKAKRQAIPIIAEEVYKDSEKYIYILHRSGGMYALGNLSTDFKEGYVVIRGPHSRRRYYEGGKPNNQHPTGQALWFERTKKENIDKYKKQYSLVFNQVKKGG
jgi:hypothetical protein